MEKSNFPILYFFFSYKCKRKKTKKVDKLGFSIILNLKIPQMRKSSSKQSKRKSKSNAIIQSFE